VSNEVITTLDLLRIYVENSFINGNPVNEIDLKSFDFDKYIKSQKIKDFDSDKFFKEWHRSLEKSPWRYHVFPITELEPSDFVAVIVHPATEFRDKIGCWKNPSYKNGYEWPILVVCEYLTSKTSRRLKIALSVTERLQNYNFLEVKRASQFALLFLTYVHLYHMEETAARLNISPLLARGSLANCPLKDNKIQKIKTMSEEEKIAITIKLGQPLFNLESVLDSWESFGQTLATDIYDDSDDSGIWLFTMLPPLSKSFEEVKSTLEGKGERTDEPMVRVDYETSKLAKEVRVLTKDAPIPMDRLIVDLLNSGGTLADNLDPEVALFKKIGSVWVIAYKSKLRFLHDLKGLQYLQFLLKYPGKEYHVTVLQDAVEGREFSDVSNSLSQLSASVLKEIGLSIGKSDDPVALIDKRTRRCIEEQCKKLKALLKANSFKNPDQRVECREDLDFCKSYLQKSTGLGGKDRKFPSNTERLRSNLNMRISKAMSIIGESNNTLWMHLKKSIILGTFVTYQPENPTSWEC